MFFENLILFPVDSLNVLTTMFYDESTISIFKAQILLDLAFFRLILYVA